MKTRILILAAATFFAACGGGAQRPAASNDAPDMHTAETALDYQGVYKATLPAADCPGIDATLSLLKDGTYTLLYKYIDRNSEFTEKGGYALSGNLLTLTPADGEGVGTYKVEEGQLRQLDGDKQVIEGEIGKSFIYKKQAE